VTMNDAQRHDRDHDHDHDHGGRRETKVWTHLRPRDRT